jgi:hypothetical protein
MDLSEFADHLVAFMQAFWLSVLIIGAGISIRERFWCLDIADRRSTPPDQAPDHIDDMKGPGLSAGA